SVGLGARFALEPGRGRRRAPIGTTLLACTCGVAGVAAALVFGSGLQAAVDDPGQLGQTYTAFTLTGMQGQDFIPPAVVRRTLSGLSAVSAVEESRAGQAHTADGKGELWLKDFTGFSPVVLSGRLPASADEISLTPATAADLHTAVGRQVTLRGDGGPVTFDVVGESYLYTGFLERYNFGGWIAPTGYDRLFHAIGMRYWYLVGHPGTTQADIRAEMLAKHPDWLAEGLSVMPPDIAQAQRNMSDVRGLPLFLGAFLAVLAIAAAAHALALSIRRRRHDLGIARTLGMTPSQGATALVVQSLVSTAVGVVVGLPLGVAAGRTAWRWMATQIPVQFLPPGPWGELGVIALAALGLALLIAALPAARAARLPIADALRAE
ncbi:MAG TPA: FtsX-like permease family protein, partial [Nocardioides sp.]|nr:FtsX-like permease family protein [Nocardioides sp.]